jgi:ADP-ribosylarginine hydrolase
LCENIAQSYVKCWDDMGGRAPGGTCGMGVFFLSRGKKWDYNPFKMSAGGCGAAMRSMCIGLVFSDQFDELIALAIDSGRMTHHAPTGYLGSVVSAVFTAYAIKDVPVRNWGYMMLEEIIPVCRNYIVKSGRFVKENLDNFDYFLDKWTEYLKIRKLTKQDCQNNVQITWPEPWDIKTRDAFYKSVSFSGLCKWFLFFFFFFIVYFYKVGEEVLDMMHH